MLCAIDADADRPCRIEVHPDRPCFQQPRWKGAVRAIGCTTVVSRLHVALWQVRAAAPVPQRIMAVASPVAAPLPGMADHVDQSERNGSTASCFRGSVIAVASAEVIRTSGCLWCPLLELPGPSGWRRPAPSTDGQQGSLLLRGNDPPGGTNTIDAVLGRSHPCRRRVSRGPGGIAAHSEGSCRHGSSGHRSIRRRRSPPAPASPSPAPARSWRPSGAVGTPQRS